MGLSALAADKPVPPGYWDMNYQSADFTMGERHNEDGTVDKSMVITTGYDNTPSGNVFYDDKHDHVFVTDVTNQEAYEIWRDKDHHWQIRAAAAPQIEEMDAKGAKLAEPGSYTDTTYRDGRTAADDEAIYKIGLDGSLIFTAGSTKVIVSADAQNHYGVDVAYKNNLWGDFSAVPVNFYTDPSYQTTNPPSPPFRPAEPKTVSAEGKIDDDNGRVKVSLTLTQSDYGVLKLTAEGETPNARKYRLTDGDLTIEKKMADGTWQPIPIHSPSEWRSQPHINTPYYGIRSYGAAEGIGAGEYRAVYHVNDGLHYEGVSADGYNATTLPIIVKEPPPR